MRSGQEGLGLYVCAVVQGLSPLRMCAGGSEPCRGCVMPCLMCRAESLKRLPVDVTLCCTSFKVMYGHGSAAVGALAGAHRRCGRCRCCAAALLLSTDADVLCLSTGFHNPVLLIISLLRVQAAPPPRHGHTAVWDGADALVLYGGTNGAAVFSDVRVLCLASGRWHAPACEGAVPPPRYGHAAALVAANLMLVFGGCDGQALPRLVRQGATASPRARRKERTSHAATCALKERNVICMPSMCVHWPP